MKKKFIATALCVSVAMALCACGTKTPGESGVPTSMPTELLATSTPEATPEVTTAPSLDEAYAALPVTDYEEYVETTVLPEGYVGFEVVKITEADVDAYVQEVLENHKDRELKDGPVENTDIVIIDYTGYMDGVTFEGGSDMGAELEIGSGTFIEGFEEGLIGAMKGETRSLELKFPEDYHSAAHAGKEVVFEVKVNSIAAQVLPEFTDDFVAEVTSGEYSTTEEFRGYAMGYLAEERKYTEIMDYLVENATFGALNEEYIAETFELEKEYYAMMYGYNNVAEFEAAFGVENSTVLWAMVEKQIRRYEQDRIALYCVAKAENLTLEEEEYQAAIAEYAESNGMTVEKIYEIQDEASMRQSMLMEEALEYLLNNIVEVEEGAE